MLLDFHRLVQRFRRDQQGNVAIIFSVASIPVLGLTGMALDYSTAGNVRTYLRAQADAAAIQVAVAKKDSQTVDTASLFASMKTAAKDKFGLDMTFTGKWSDDNLFYTVTGTASVPTSLSAVLGVTSGQSTSTIELSPASTAEVRTVTSSFSPPPEYATLDPEAADYNRIYVYCFDKDRKSLPDGGRSQMTAIADNGGTTYSFTMPKCKSTETISYRLYNVRNSRTNKPQWESGTAARYNHYTDTTIQAGVPEYNFTGLPANTKILETVLCSTKAECMSPAPDGLLPTPGRNRTPAAATAACAEGKFMYYGWEDRPTGDRDYDDIRLVIECPKTVVNSKTYVLLVK